jgi:hypothetical protein
MAKTGKPDPKPKPTLAEARLAVVLSELKDANRTLDRIRALQRYERIDLASSELYVRDEELRRILGTY